MFNYQIKKPGYDDLRFILSINKRMFKDKCLSEYQSELIFKEIITNSKGIFLTIIHGNRMAGYAYATEVFSLGFGHYSQVVDFNVLDYYMKHNADEVLLSALENRAYDMLCSEMHFVSDGRYEDMLKRMNYVKDENSQIYKKQLFSFEFKKGRSILK